jgi:hypothetical protein
MAMTRASTEQSAENMAYVRALFRRRQPEWAAALEVALMMAELELTCLEMPDIADAK